MKQTWKSKVFCLLLACAMLLGLLPAGTVTVHAEWIENGQWCLNCDTYDSDDEICNECFQHYDDCGSSPTHCSVDSGHCITRDDFYCDVCGACYECILGEGEDSEHCAYELGNCDTIHHVSSVCSGCGRCDDCASNDANHCYDCHECDENDPDFWCTEHGKTGEHCNDCAAWCAECGNCYYAFEEFLAPQFDMCIKCAKEKGLMCEEEGCEEDALDDVCGLCYEHAWEKNAHCHLCGECDVVWCDNGGEHCVAECCEICEACGECALELGKSLCPYCGLCEECCAEVAYGEGCSCGYICVESSEWEYHFCECGNCFDDYAQCPDCELCEECCESNGCDDCGMCVESSEYDSHFCEGCGECLVTLDYCDICGLCLDCCEGNSDCTEGLCVESPEYDDHFCETCGSCFHEVDQCAECADTATNRCVEDCEEHAESDAEEHTHQYNAANACTICGIKRYVSQEAPEIIRQPSDTAGRVTDINGFVFEDDVDNNTVAFHVRVLDDAVVSYQWQRRYQFTNGNYSSWTSQSGATDEDFVYSIDEDGCDYTGIQFRCIVTGANGLTTTSKTAVLTVDHYFGRWDYETATKSQHALYCVYTGCSKYKSDTRESHKFMGWVVDKESTVTETGLRHHICRTCGYRESEVIATYHEHVWCDVYDQWDDYHARYCTVAGCREISDKLPHEWGEEITVVTEPTDTTFGVGERTCTVCGYIGTTKIDKLPHTHDYEKNPDILTVKSFKYSHDGGVTYDSKSHWIGCISCGASYTQPELHTFKVEYSYSEKTGKATVNRTCTECYYTSKIKFTDDDLSDMGKGWAGLIVAPGCNITCVRLDSANRQYTVTSRDYGICTVDDACDVYIEARLQAGQGVSGWTKSPAVYGNMTNDEYFTNPVLTDDTLHFTVGNVNEMAGGISFVAKFTPTITSVENSIPVNRVAEPVAGANPSFANDVPRNVTILSQTWEEVGGNTIATPGGSAPHGKTLLDTFEAGKLYRYTITLSSTNQLYPITGDSTVLLNASYPNIDRQLTDVTLNADGSLTAVTYYSVKASAMDNVGAMYIDDIFTYNDGADTVLTGTVASGSFTTGDTIYLYSSSGTIQSMTIEKLKNGTRELTSAEKGDAVGIFVNGTQYPKSIFTKGDGISTSSSLTFTDTVSGTLLNSGRPTAMADGYRPQVAPEGTKATVTAAISGLNGSTLAKGSARQNVSLTLIRKMMVCDGLDLTLTEGGRTVGTFTVAEDGTASQTSPSLVIFGTVVEGSCSGTDRSGNSWTYNANTRTLTLNHISDIPSSNADVTPAGLDAAIYCDGDLIIDTGSSFGSNYISFSGSSNASDMSKMNYYGICVTGNLTVQGSSCLDVSLDCPGQGSKAVGIYAGGSITWKSWGQNSVWVSGPEHYNATTALMSGSGELVLQCPELYLSAFEKGKPARVLGDGVLPSFPGACISSVTVDWNYDADEGEYTRQFYLRPDQVEDDGYYTDKVALTFYRYGDINRDGLATLLDVALMYQLCIGTLNWDENTLYQSGLYADVTGDGALNMKDVSVLFHAIIA